MAKAKGIQAHKIFKLGKAPAKKDSRNLKFATLLRATAPKLPSSYDFDTTHSGIPTPMFGNDVHGDCVIAGRAHQTLRFEDIEQGSVLMITDKEVLKEYFKETGGPDTGLVVLDSLNEWRHKGWKVGKHNYKIQAFAEVDFRKNDEVRQAVFADVGVLAKEVHSNRLGLNISARDFSPLRKTHPEGIWRATSAPSND